MRLKVAFPLAAALLGLGALAPPAAASHCGACAYPTGCASPEQCCMPSVRYRVCYKTIVEEQTEWIVRYQPDLTITFANGAYGRHLGRSQEGLIGTNLSAIMTSEPREFLERLAGLSPAAPTLA